MLWQTFMYYLPMCNVSNKWGAWSSKSMGPVDTLCISFQLWNNFYQQYEFVKTFRREAHHFISSLIKENCRSPKLHNMIPINKTDPKTTFIHLIQAQPLRLCSPVLIYPLLHAILIILVLTFLTLCDAQLQYKPSYLL
jgi:hypothetical protein